MDGPTEGTSNGRVGYGDPARGLDSLVGGKTLLARGQDTRIN